MYYVFECLWAANRVYVCGIATKKKYNHHKHYGFIKEVIIDFILEM